jgi:hypothetical protein
VTNWWGVSPRARKIVVFVTSVTTHEEEISMTGELIPFGKYKGQPLEVIAGDRSYCDWLLAQAWFVQRYPQIHTLVINNFGEPSETPEHNALQIRFLDDRFRHQCMALVLQSLYSDEYLEYFDRRFGARPTSFFRGPDAPIFEQNGVDVTLSVVPWLINLQCKTTNKTHTVDWFFAYEEDRILVECKPVLGDDYPAVLRFVKNLPGRPGRLVVLAGAVASRAVSLNDIKKFFALSDVLLLLVEEVEQATPMVLHDAASLPPAHEVYLRFQNTACPQCRMMGAHPLFFNQSL